MSPHSAPRWAVPWWEWGIEQTGKCYPRYGQLEEVLWLMWCSSYVRPIDLKSSIILSPIFQNGHLAAILDFAVSGLCSWHGFCRVTRVCFGISTSNFMWILFVAMSKILLIFRDITFKMAAWQPYWIIFVSGLFGMALNIKSKLQSYITCV